MATDGEMNVGVLAAEANAEYLRAENHKLKMLCARLRDELFTSGISYHLVKEANEILSE